MVENIWNITAASDSRLNKMTVVANTGTYLASLTKLEHGLVICTATGGGLILDHTYMANAAGTAWIDISSIVDHTHSSTTGDGGGIGEVFRLNPTFMDTAATFLFNLSITNLNLTETVTSTGTVTDQTDGTTTLPMIRLATGATSGSGATSVLKGLKLNFALNSHFQMFGKYTATTAEASHIGPGMEDATAADDNIAKYGFHTCTVTNANFNARSATGSAKSDSDTGTAVSTSQVSLKAQHFPTAATPKVDFYVNGGTVFTKTTDIPTTGATAQGNLMKFTLKNSAAADKQFNVYGFRLRYYISDTWF